MKSGLKISAILGGVSVIAFSSGFLSQIKINKGETPVEVEPFEFSETHQERFLSNLTKISAFSLDANIKIAMESGERFAVDFSGEADLSSLDDLKINGEGSIKLGSTTIPLGLAYYDNVIYFNYRENYFKMQSDNVFDFVKMLPTTYGLNIELPEELTSLSLDTLQASIAEMEDYQLTPQGEYFFTFPLTEDLIIYFKTNENCEFLGVRTDNVFFENMYFSIDADLDMNANVSIENPSLGEKANYYQDFEPALTLFDVAYKLISKKQGLMNLAIDLDKYDEELSLYKDLISTSIDVDFDLNDELKLSLGGSIYQDNHNYAFNFAYLDKAIYASYHDIKVSVETESISYLISYALSKFSDEQIKDALNKVVATVSDSNILGIIENADAALKNITLTSEQLAVLISPEELGLNNVSDLTLAINFTSDSLKSITISGLEYSNLKLDVVISFKDYELISINKESYVAIDPALRMVEGIDNLINQNAYRLEFDGVLSNSDVEVNDIPINGGLQFNLEEQFGYGDITIVDQSNYTHHIQADMKSPEEILFVYNSELKGKFNTNTGKELIELIKSFIDNPDDHFYELFGGIMDEVGSMPIYDAIANKDFADLLDCHILSDLVVTDSYTQVKVHCGFINRDDITLTLKIRYSDNQILGLNIMDLVIDDYTLNLNVDLSAFDESKESERLSQYDKYIDFSDIKVLLELGANTSRYNYYHATAVANVSFGLGSTSLFKKDVNVDVKIRSDKGNVQVAISLPDIPVIVGVNKRETLSSSETRSANIYYADGLFYVQRTDVCKHLLASTKTYVTAKVYTAEYFFANIVNILCEDVLYMGSLVMDQIENATSNSGGQIQYEKVLNDFAYTKTSNSHYFYIDLNLAEIAHNDQLTSCVVKVYSDDTTNQLTGINAKLIVDISILNITLNIDLSVADKEVDANENNRLLNLEWFVSAHANDTPLSL